MSTEDISQEKSDDIVRQLTITIPEGFYAFYSVPWDQDKFVKFPVDSIVRDHSQPSKMEFTDPITTNHTSHFLKKHYLGSARLDDEVVTRKILNYRTELSYP